MPLQLTTVMLGVEDGEGLGCTVDQALAAGAGVVKEAAGSQWGTSGTSATRTAICGRSRPPLSLGELS